MFLNRVRYYFRKRILFLIIIIIIVQVVDVCIDCNILIFVYNINCKSQKVCTFSYT